MPVVHYRLSVAFAASLSFALAGCAETASRGQPDTTNTQQASTSESSELDTEAGYFRANALALRNPAVANFLDRCAISIPAHHGGEAPVGVMLMGEHAEDRKLFAIARAVEAAWAAQRGLS